MSYEIYECYQSPSSGASCTAYGRGVQRKFRGVGMTPKNWTVEK